MERNKKLFETDKNVEPSSRLLNEKSLTPDQLFDMLKVNKQEASNNFYSAELSMRDADKLCSKSSLLVSDNKTSLTEQEYR